MSDKVKRKHS